jgi:Skp family chaperone for outer membrane proteins
MPNSLGRRRSAGAPAEVEQLKKEIEDLKAAYVRDMQNISADMVALNNKVEPQEPAV